MWNRKQAIDEYNYWSDSRVINSMIKVEPFFVKGSASQINMDWVREQWDLWSENEDLYDTEEDWTYEQCVEAADKAFETWLKNLGAKATVVSNSKFEICPTCEGRGTHTNPSIDSGGITASEWAEWSYEEQDDYMSGVYDVICSQCSGEKVIQILEYDTSNRLYNWCCKIQEEIYEAEYEHAQLVAMERRFGC